MAFRIRPRFFNAPPCDEVALAAQARTLVDGARLDYGRVVHLMGNHPADLAARLLYEAWMTSEHGEFVQALDRFSAARVERSNGRVRLVIVPGMFYREHPEVGGDGAMALEIARRFGFETERAPIHGTGSVAANSRLLAEYLARIDDGPIWLLSLSKGANDVRHYLQQADPLPGIRGWISVSGTASGSPLADEKLKSAAGRLFYRGLCGVAGIDYRVLEEMRTTHSFWRSTQWPADIEIIHLQPLPLASHVQGFMRARHRRLQRHGPNDGFVPVAEVMRLPGRIYPVWGSDHFLRTPQLSSIIYRLFNYISQAAP